MAVFSTLSRILYQTKPFFPPDKSKYFSLKTRNAFLQAFRNMAGGGDHERIMNITPSRFQYRRFKDDLHFYLTIGAIPTFLLIFFVNIFVGPAELSEIPEGYTPKHWEYFKSPFERYIARNFCEDPQVEYEKVLHHLNEQYERAEYRIAMEKVKHLMSTRDDYRGWYYIPSDQGRLYRKARNIQDNQDEDYGYS